MASLSVVVPAFNAAATLPTLLRSLAAGDDLPEEIIVVDDASTDETGELARQFSGVRWLRFSQNRGPAAARNYGARQATGEIVLFLDADVAVEPSTIRRCRTHFNHPDCHVLIGTYSPRPLNSGRFAEYKALHVYSFVETGRFTDSLEGFCCAIRTPTFLASGGFNEQYAAAAIEDLEFGHRLQRSHPLWFDRELQVRHTFPSFWKNTRLYFTRTGASVHYGLSAGFKPRVMSFLLPGIGSLAAVALAGAVAALPFFPLPAGILAGGAGLGFGIGSWRLLRAIARVKGVGWLITILPFHYVSYLTIGVALLIALATHPFTASRQRPPRIS